MVNLISPNGVPYLATEEALANLLEVGFKRYEEPATPKLDFNSMTRAELLEYAEAHNVTVNARANKATIIVALVGDVHADIRNG